MTRHEANPLTLVPGLLLIIGALVCLRGDTDFSLTAHFDRWAKRVDFIFGADCCLWTQLVV